MAARSKPQKKKRNDLAKPAAHAMARSAKKATTAAGARAESLIRLVAIKKREIEDAFYDLGLALRELATKKLYSALGYSSFGELLRARRVFGASQAKKLIAIVSTVDRETAIDLGVEKAYATLRLSEATAEEDSPKLLAEENPRIGGKRFSEMSAKETMDAASSLRARGKTKPGAGKAPATIAKKVQAWARRAGAKTAKASARRRGGAWIIAVEIRLEEASALVEASS